MSADFSVYQALNTLAELQQEERNYFPEGVFPSYRYHRYSFYSRPDDNVYFTSFVLIALKKCWVFFTEQEKALASSIIEKGEIGLTHYRSRLGDVSYNFYRPDGYFPNGQFLSKKKKYQPTDDADDSCIAFRAKEHSLEEARELKKMLVHRANGKRDRWIKRNPQAYRKLPLYSTWIGTDQLFIDNDLCVLANILAFNQQYNLPLSTEDQASVDFISTAILNGDYLQKNWAISAWYPFYYSIFFQLSEVLGLKGLNFKKPVLHRFTDDLLRYHAKEHDHVRLLFLEQALRNIAVDFDSKVDFSAYPSLRNWLNQSSGFTYGVIPLTQPIDGLFSQYLGGQQLLQIHYRCDAQALAMLTQHLVHTRQTLL